MNKKQRIVLLAAACAIFLMFFFPPYIINGRVEGYTFTQTGYGFLFSLPDAVFSQAKINSVQIESQIFGVLAIAGLLLLAFKDQNSS